MITAPERAHSLPCRALCRKAGGHHLWTGGMAIHARP